MGVKPSKHSSSHTEPCVPVNHDEKFPSYRAFLATVEPPMPPAVHPPGLSKFVPYVPQVIFNIASANPFEVERILDEHRLVALATAISFARRVCLTPSAIIATGKILSLSRTKLAGRKPLSTYKWNECAEQFVNGWFERDVTVVFAREKAKNLGSAAECPAISPADDVRSAMIHCFLPLEVIAIAGRARESGGEESPIFIAQCIYLGFCLAHTYQRAMRRHYDYYINAIVPPSLNVLDQVWGVQDGKAPSSNVETTLDERESGWYFEEEVVGGCVCTYDFNRTTCSNVPVNLPIRILDNSTQMPFRYFCIDLHVLIELLHATSKRLETLLPLTQWRRDPYTHIIIIERHGGVRGPKVWRGPREPWPALTDQYVAPPPEVPNASAGCGYPHYRELEAAAKLAMEKRAADR